MKFVVLTANFQTADSIYKKFTLLTWFFIINFQSFDLACQYNDYRTL